MKSIQKMRARLLLNSPFFGSLIMSTPFKERPDIPTAATDMNNVYYNPEFMESLTIEQGMFVLAHETLHMALQHGLRLQGRNPMLFNIACDYAINLTLKETGFEVLEGCLLDTKYKGMSAEHIYDLLKREVDQHRKRGGRGQSGSGEDGESMPGSGVPEDRLGQDVHAPANMDPETAARAERTIQQRVAQAANVARMAGKLPGALERLVDEILNPQVPWQDLLRDYMTRVTKDDESWARRNRRFGHVYLPARHSERMGEIIFIGDTSGSITNDELARVAAEVAAVAVQVQPERIRILWADTRVAGEQVFECGEPIACKPEGGGGTDMRVPLEEALKHDPQVVVLMTDGFTPWPEIEPEYPLIVCCTTEAPVPVGLVIRL